MTITTLTIPITLPEYLAGHYAEKAARTGKSIDELLLADIEKYHEAGRFEANEKERI